MNALEQFVRPLYQDLDGASRFDSVERVSAIARRLAGPSRELDLLLLFHGLGGWLARVGSRSRASLATGLSEIELVTIEASIRRLEHPVSEAERAVAAATAIDQAGVRGLAERLSRARREGLSIEDVARAAMTPEELPAWMPVKAVLWMNERIEARIQVCEQLLDELWVRDPERRE